MRAIINDEGKIMKITTQQGVGVDIGVLPQGVGLERLRFIDNKLIDMATLNEFWVDKNARLHPNKIFGTQKVVMDYSDRKRLIRDVDIWKVKTIQKIEDEKLLQAKERKRMEIKRTLQSQIGDTEKILNLLIKAVLNNDLTAKDKLKDYSEIHDKEK